MHKVDFNLINYNLKKEREEKEIDLQFIFEDYNKQIFSTLGIKRKQKKVLKEESSMQIFQKIDDYFEKKYNDFLEYEELFQKKLNSMYESNNRNVALVEFKRGFIELRRTFMLNDDLNDLEVNLKKIYDFIYNKDDVSRYIFSIIELLKQYNEEIEKFYEKELKKIIDEQYCLFISDKKEIKETSKFEEILKKLNLDVDVNNYYRHIIKDNILYLLTHDANLYKIEVILEKDGYYIEKRGKNTEGFKLLHFDTKNKTCIKFGKNPQTYILTGEESLLSLTDRVDHDVVCFVNNVHKSNQNIEYLNNFIEEIIDNIVLKTKLNKIFALNIICNSILFETLSSPNSILWQCSPADICDKLIKDLPLNILKQYKENNGLVEEGLIYEIVLRISEYAHVNIAEAYNLYITNDFNDSKKNLPEQLKTKILRNNSVIYKINSKK